MSARQNDCSQTQVSSDQIVVRHEYKPSSYFKPDKLSATIFRVRVCSIKQSIINKTRSDNFRACSKLQIDSRKCQGYVGKIRVWEYYVNNKALFEIWE